MARISPNPAPANAKTRFSVKSWRRMRFLSAPNAERTANSRSRRIKRVSAKFATLAQARISTMSTVPIMIKNVGRADSVRTSCHGRAVIS